MMAAIWVILLVLGLRAQRLSWKPFAAMAIIAVAATALYDYVAVDTALRAGRDESLRWHPLVFAADCAVTTTLYAATYLIGFACGRWWRRGR